MGLLFCKQRKITLDIPLPPGSSMSHHAGSTAGRAGPWRRRLDPSAAEELWRV